MAQTHWTLASVSRAGPSNIFAIYCTTVVIRVSSSTAHGPCPVPTLVWVPRPPSREDGGYGFVVVRDRRSRDRYGRGRSGLLCLSLNGPRREKKGETRRPSPAFWQWWDPVPSETGRPDSVGSTERTSPRRYPRSRPLPTPGHRGRRDRRMVLHPREQTPCSRRCRRGPNRPGRQGDETVNDKEIFCFVWLSLSFFLIRVNCLRSRV